VSGTWKCSPSVTFSTEGRPISMSHERPCVICFVVWPATKILNYKWLTLPLQWRNVNEYRLPSKNAHCPNYCSWLAVCDNYSVNFYCKIALINRFKLYLIKIYSKTPKNKNKQTKRIQKQRRIYLTFAFSERHVTSPGVTL